MKERPAWRSYPSFGVYEIKWVSANFPLTKISNAIKESSSCNGLAVNLDLEERHLPYSMNFSRTLVECGNRKRERSFIFLGYIFFYVLVSSLHTMIHENWQGNDHEPSCICRCIVSRQCSASFKFALYVTNSFLRMFHIAWLYLQVYSMVMRFIVRDLDRWDDALHCIWCESLSLGDVIGSTALSILYTTYRLLSSIR